MLEKERWSKVEHTLGTWSSSFQFCKYWLKNIFSHLCIFFLDHLKHIDVESPVTIVFGEIILRITILFELLAHSSSAVP
jgi:hypothetical protein